MSDGKIGVARREVAGMCLAGPLAGLLPTTAEASPRGLPDGAALAQDIARGRLSALAAADAALDRIARFNPTIGAVVSVDAERARDSARRVAPGASVLAGVPTLVKDLVDVRGFPTRRGSRATPTAPATSQPPLIDAMEAAGLVILGKSQTPEFGASPTTEPLLGPITRNPVSVGYTAGGSSGGAAAAVAAGMVAIAQGSDGGGSLRMPASCCGVFALKPSRGRLMDSGGPRQRIEMSVPGAISRSVRDNAAFISLTERHDAAALPPIGFVAGPSARRLRIGLNLKTLRGSDPDPEIAEIVLAVAAQCRLLGHDVRPFDWNFDQSALADALGVTMLVALAGMANNIMQQNNVSLDETGLEPLHIRMAQAGMALAPEIVAQTFARFEDVQTAYPAIFAERDLILTPTLAQLPPLLGRLDDTVASVDEVVAGYNDFSPYTAIENIAGAPAMSLPLGVSRSGLPIGVHVAGPIGAERTLLELAYELERAMPWRPGSARGTMQLSRTPQQIERAFREALGDGNDPVGFAQWMATMWADEVFITHEPAMTRDGPIQGRMLAEGEVRVFAAIKQALPDYRQENFTIRARGDVLHFHEEIVATLPSGEVRRVPIDYRFTLQNGRIVRAHGLFDPLALKPFSDVVAAAGERTPD